MSRGKWIKRTNIRSKLVVKHPDLFVICPDEDFEAVVEGQGSVSDFLQDCLEKDDGRGEAGGLDQIHLKKTTVSVRCGEERKYDLGEEYVGVWEDIVAGRELLVGRIACGGKNRIDCTSADATRDDATVYVITKIALS